MPKASAPKAPCVDVWLSPQTIVMPGCVSAELGPDDVHDALLGRVEVVERDRRTRRSCASSFASCASACASTTASPRGKRRRRVVHRGHGALGAAHREAARAQAGEGLRRGHLVDEVQVDVEHRRGARRPRATTCVAQTFSNSVLGAS